MFKHWRHRADAMRAVLESMRDVHAARLMLVMLDLAQDYEKLADRGAKREQNNSGIDTPTSGPSGRGSPPKFTDGIRPEARSRGSVPLQCCWHVRYEFCGLSAEITVYAENKTEARAKAVNQLCVRGLKVVRVA
jgi:hypothetical protein